MAGFLVDHMDRLAIKPISTTTFVYVNDYYSKKMKMKDIDEVLDTKGLLSDIIVILIIAYILDDSSRNDFYNHYYLRKYKYNLNLDTNLTFFSIVIQIIVLNLYSVYKIKRELSSTRTDITIINEN